MSVRFNLARRTGYPDNRPVVIKLIAKPRGGSTITRSLDIKVPPGKWSTTKHRVTPSLAGATAINGVLDRLHADLTMMMLTGLRGAELEAAIDDRLGRPSTEPIQHEPTILDHYEEFFALKVARTKLHTQQTYNSLRKHLVSFLKSRRQSNASPDAIGAGFLDDFVSYAVKAGLANSTTNKMLTRLRGFLTYLKDREHIAHIPKAKPLSSPKAEVLYLKSTELAAIEALDLPSLTPLQRKARTVFMFAAATAQRFGDVAAAKWDHMSGLDTLTGSAPHVTWHLTVAKTGVMRRIPVIGPALDILRRRHQQGASRPLPRISNAYANGGIKEVAALAGLCRLVPVIKTKGGQRTETMTPLHEAVTMHTARKTFITLAMQSGMDTQELLGFTHDDLRTLQRYAGQDEDRRRHQMSRALLAAKSTSH